MVNVVMVHWGLWILLQSFEKETWLILSFYFSQGYDAALDIPILHMTFMPLALLHQFTMDYGIFFIQYLSQHPSEPKFSCGEVGSLSCRSDFPLLFLTSIFYVHCRLHYISLFRVRENTAVLRT